MSNSRPATVIVLDGLRICLPTFTKRPFPLRRPQFSPQTSASITRNISNLTTTSQASTPEIYTPPIRALKWPPKEPSRKKEIEIVTKTASPERLYELLRIEASMGVFKKVEAYTECLMRVHKEAPNPRIYSALILANVSALGSIASVKDYVRQMREDGFDLDVGTCHDILKVLAVHPDYLFRAEILEYMQEKWLQLSDVGRHDLVAGYIRDCSFEMALDELEHMKAEGVKIQRWLHDMVIYALAKRGEFDAALSILQSRIADGDVNVSTMLWNYLLDTSSAACHYEMASYVWKKQVQTHYISPPLNVYLNILTAAARQGDTELATHVFTELGSRDVVFEHQHYEMLVEAYITSGDVETALSVMCVMQESKLYPNSRTTRSLFKYLSKSPDRPNEIFESLRALQHFGKSVPTAALNCVMEAAIYHQDLELAVEFYKALHEICPRGANIDTFNELLRGCHYGKRKDLALLLASELQALGLKPDNLTYDRMLIVCTNENDYEDALQYYAEMRSQRVEPRSGTLLYLIKTLVKAMDERVFGIVDDLEEMNLGAGMRTSVQRIKVWIRRNWMGDQEVMERRLTGWST